MYTLILLLLCLSLGLSNTDVCHDNDQQFLITFHPHLDAFWLNFDTELKDINFRPAGFLYQMNQRNSKTILNSMVSALTQQGSVDNGRKYFITQAVFFKDWYDYLAKDQRQIVKQLLASGQLQIANGAWVENDEAVCYYDDILDQYTIGMNFLYSQFNYQIKIGWATDSFGHSHSQAALQHLLGIQFQGIQRVDQRFINLHHGGPLLQFFWSPVSDSNNITYGGVLNHVRHFLHQVNNYRNTQTQAISRDYTQIKQAMHKYYNKSKLFRFLGNDFQEFIPEQFVILQKVMKELNGKSSQSCPIFKYGNPTDYLQLITKYYDLNSLPVRKYDLMPNWDQDRYWTGYYTTDPLLKKACKDFSRLVNFYRKSLLSTDQYSKYQQTLNKAQELLAVVQHHDGITATSKTYIEDEFRNRMHNKTAEIIGNLKSMHNAVNSVVCKIFENNNQCIISDIEATSGTMITSLSILAHGGSRKQKIQVKLPTGHFYDLQGADQDIFCDGQVCTLVFEASIHPGVNKFKIAQKQKQELSSQIFDFQTSPGMYFNGRDFVISIDSAKKHQIRYEYGDSEFFTIGLYTSANRGSSRQSGTWDKYGQRRNKTEYVVPGMYIMGNTGKIQPVFENFTEMKVAEGRIYKKVIAKHSTSKVKITIKNDQPNIIDVVHDFRPPSRNMVDYFMKVESTVRSDTLYHDSNGFLVIKRPLNWRPDYEAPIKPQDMINANTYPVCSFAYLLQGDKKLLFFTDRAQGVSTYEQDLLINYDRLAMDDGKGVGQGYAKTMNNSFRYKFALISAKDDTERVWQRSYDQALIGFYQKGNQENIKYKNDASSQISHVPGLGPVSNLKYSLFWLNENEYVLRLQNLAEFTNLPVPKYTGSQGSYTWDIQQIGLKLHFFDVRDSYANGIPKQSEKQKKPWRRYWSKSSTIEVNINNQGTNDGENLSLRPLEIRSFRINTKQVISSQDPNSGKIAAFGVIKNSHKLKQLLRKRCF